MTFHDRAKETPATLRIERVGGEGAPAIDPATFEASLQRAVGFVRGTSKLFVEWMNAYSAHENKLPSDDQERCMRCGGDSQIHYLQSRWRVGPDEALWIKVPRIPKCATWNLQISNYWMESLDYRYHQIALNHHGARKRSDGSVRLVVAHEDPGVGNWLDTAGHARGTMCLRWVGADSQPDPTTRVVKRSDLRAAGA
jgi:hypothetical protein